MSYFNILKKIFQSFKIDIEKKEIMFYNNTMKIAIDLDKTLFECKSKIYDLMVSLEHVIIKPPSKPTILEPSEADIKNINSRNMFGKIGNPELYTEVDGSVGFINKLASEGNQIVFLSSRPNMRTMNNVIMTWLQKYNVNYDFVVVSCSNKAKFCKEHGIKLLIDDGLRNCYNASNEGVTSIFLDNKGKYEPTDKLFINNKKLHHAKNWRNVYKIAEKVIEKEEQNSEKDAGESAFEL